MTKRNGFVELMRFVFAIMVVGYHLGNFGLAVTAPVFNYGFYAVEFFFILSGFLLAKSIEKQRGKDCKRLLGETGAFMWKKVKALLPFHILANLLVIIIIAVFQTQTLASRLLEGLPALFLVQILVVWTFPQSLIVPEWYLSAMLVIMLITYPLCRLLGRKMKGIFSVLTMFGLVIVLLLIGGFATNWTLFGDQRFWNLQQLIRSFGEMLLGMLCYYASATMSKAKVNGKGKIAITAAMLACYVTTLVIINLPAVGVIPAVGLPIAMVLLALAIIFNFSGHDLLADKCTSKAFAYLGAISLPIYLVHTAVINLFLYAAWDIPVWAVILLVFVLSIGLSVAAYEAVRAVNKAIFARKAKRAAKQSIELAAKEDAPETGGQEVEAAEPEVEVAVQEAAPIEQEAAPANNNEEE